MVRSTLRVVKGEQGCQGTILPATLRIHRGEDAERAVSQRRTCACSAKLSMNPSAPNSGVVASISIRLFPAVGVFEFQNLLNCLRSSRSTACVTFTILQGNLKNKFHLKTMRSATCLCSLCQYTLQIRNSSSSCALYCSEIASWIFFRDTCLIKKGFPTFQ